VSSGQLMNLAWICYIPENWANIYQNNAFDALFEIKKMIWQIKLKNGRISIN